MAEGRAREFDEPILLPRGRKLETHGDAANYVTELPESESDLPEWHAAIEALLLVVELGGPTMFAGIAMLRALNRNRQNELGTRRKRCDPMIRRAAICDRFRRRQTDRFSICWPRHPAGFRHHPFR